MSTEALPYSDHLFRALIEHSTDAIALMAVDGTLTYASPSTLRIIGYPANEFVGMNGFALIHPDDLPAVQTHISSILGQHGAFIAFEFRFLHKDGTYRWLESTATNLLQDPAIGAIVGNYHDITERKRLEAELENRARELETILETITDSIFVYDIAGKLRRTNAAARALNPLTTDPTYLARPFVERIQNMQPRDIIDHEDHSENVPVLRVLRGEVFTGKDAVDSVAHISDGRDLLLNVSGAPFRDEHGQIQGGVIVTRDVTERRTTEQHTRDALHALLIFAEALVQMPIDVEQNTLAADTAAVKSSVELVAHQLVELIRRLLNCKRVSITSIDPATGKLQSTASVGITIEQEKAWRARERGFTLNSIFASAPVNTQLSAGEVVTIDFRQPAFTNYPNPYGISTMLIAPMLLGKRLTGVLVLDHAGETHYYSEDEKILARAVAQLAALTLEQERLLFDRAQAQASILALSEINHLMNDFLGIAGHELRTPLTTIKACVQLARRQVMRVLQQEARFPVELRGLLTSVQNLLERTERQAGMQNRLINDLLDVSRIQNNHLELHPQQIDLALLLRDAVEDQQFLMLNRTIGLSLTTADAISVQADADRIRQVLSNYLSNALKYSDADAPVELFVELTDSHVRVLVRDEGPGLTSQQQQLIWDRFYRVPGIEVKSGSGIGLGLGLHISRIIIERHGGHVGVESTLGQGSTFWFTLPLATTSPT